MSRRHLFGRGNTLGKDLSKSQCGSSRLAICVGDSHYIFFNRWTNKKAGARPDRSLTLQGGMKIMDPPLIQNMAYF